MNNKQQFLFLGIGFVMVLNSLLSILAISDTIDGDLPKGHVRHTTLVIACFEQHNRRGREEERDAETH